MTFCSVSDASELHEPHRTSHLLVNLRAWRRSKHLELLKEPGQKNQEAPLTSEGRLIQLRPTDVERGSNSQRKKLLFRQSAKVLPSELEHLF